MIHCNCDDCVPENKDVYIICCAYRNEYIFVWLFVLI